MEYKLTKFLAYARYYSWEVACGYLVFLPIYVATSCVLQLRKLVIRVYKDTTEVVEENSRYCTTTLKRIKDKYKDTND